MYVAHCTHTLPALCVLAGATHPRRETKLDQAAYREDVVAEHSDGEYDASIVVHGSSPDAVATTASPSLQPRAVFVDAKGSVRRELRPTDPGEGPTSSNGDPAHVELWDGAVNDVTGGGGGGECGGRTGSVRKDYFGDFMGDFSDQTKVHVLNAIQRWSQEERAWSVHGERCPLHRDELESVEDSVRILAEKSDSLAGFVVMGDDRCVWGNVSASVLEEMRDDYRGKAMFLFATRQRASAEREAGRGGRGKIRLMEGLAVSSLAPLVDLYVPVYSHGETVDELFRSSLVGALGMFGAMLPVFSRGGASPMDMASMATSLGAGHQRCPLATLDVHSPVFASPIPLSGLTREDDVGRITECVSILGTSRPHMNVAGGGGDCDWFDVGSVSLSRPSTRVVSRTCTGVPFVRGMDEAPAFRSLAGSQSMACASVLGSTTEFAPGLRSLAGRFDPQQVRDQAALLESWGVRDRCEEVREELLSMADCFEE